MANSRFHPSDSELLSGDAFAAWRLVGLLGCVLLLVGLVDLALAWIPPRFGVVEWEFGTISSTLDSLPVSAMGTTLIVASGLQLGSGVLRWLGIAASAGFTLLLLVMAVFYALAAPVAVGNALTQSVPAATIYGAVIKGSALELTYLAFFALCTWWTIRSQRAP
jgi:hypothetical protein